MIWQSSPASDDQKDKNTSGLSDNGSRWGIKGSSDISEGLTAVYQYEMRFDGSTAADKENGLSFAGLSGGFGTITAGRLWSASYNHIGGIQDIGNVYGGGDFTARTSNTVSYAVSVGSVSFQADIQGNKGSGMSNKEAVIIIGNDANAVGTIVDNGPRPAAAAAENSVEDKSIDSGQFAATLALGSNGKVAMAYIDNDTIKHEKNTKAYLMGEYTIGGVALHLGMGQHKHDNRVTLDTDGDGTGNNQTFNETKKTDTIYAGASGGLGDTGMAFNVSFQSKKTSGRELSTNRGDDDALDADTPFHLTSRGKNKHSPWTLGLSRNLGGGAIVYFEHHNPDMDNEKSSSALGLRVDF